MQSIIHFQNDFGIWKYLRKRQFSSSQSIFHVNVRCISYVVIFMYVIYYTFFGDLKMLGEYCFKASKMIFRFVTQFLIFMDVVYYTFYAFVKY